MAAMLETPSRVWRRIEAVEGQDMPSLPSVPALSDSEAEPLTSRVLPQDSDENTDEDDDVPSPRHSTPAGSSQYNATIRPFSANTTPRLANSIGSRRSFTLARSIGSQRSKQDSFSIVKMPSLPRTNVTTGNAQDSSSDHDLEEQSKSSVPEVYLPPPEDDDELDGEDLSIANALQSVSRSNSPAPFAVDAFEDDGTPKKNYDFSASVASEPKRSPFDRFQNVVLRRTANRTRTPSLTHTLSSQSTSPTNSTPQSNRSFPLDPSHGPSPSIAARIPLPRSRTASPAVRDGSPPNTSGISETDAVNLPSAVSMDMTAPHSSSPIRGGQEGDITSGDESLKEESGLPSVDGDGVPPEASEPTFSSDSAPTPYSNRSTIRPQISSPGSIAFTPTPAFPRPRARFNLPSPPTDEIPSTPAQGQDDEDEKPLDDLVTPHTRRRSFLLSVINSTARPRLRMGTPHHRILATPSVTSMAESTPGPSKGASSPNEGSTLRTVLAGVTPRPPMAGRRRMSHPLAQAYVPSPAQSDTDSAAGYENDRMSMISTTSSQDLTSHPRANASFDPAMGFGGGATGHGIGRFNAGKLNNYLHTLNRRLQEENESLVERIQTLEEQMSSKQHSQTSPSASNTSRRLSTGSAGGNRRMSAGTILNDVEEDPAAELWLEEKAELEEMIESFKDEVTRYMAEKEEAESALENEKKERERDKERWKERMVEVEAGVAELIGELERKLEEAEKKARQVSCESDDKVKEFNRQIDDMHAEMDLVNERAEKAERALESDKDLGGALNEANERLAQVTAELRNANAHIEDSEKEMAEADVHVEELEKVHKKDQELISTLEKDIDAATEQLDTEKARVRELEVHIQGSDEELREAKAYIEELEGNTDIAGERLETLEAELTKAQNTIKKLEAGKTEASQEIAQLEEELTKAHEVNAQMEEALEEAEKKMIEDNEALLDLKSRFTALEREKERVMVDVSQNVTSRGPSEEDFEALELELDGAHKEIARLNATLVQSPARRAMEKVKDARIEMLEKEKEELLERNRTLRLTMNEMTTPHKVVNTSGISPVHRHVLSMSIRAPRTPGPPLRDLSWLNSTANDPSIAPLVAEISRLQKELDRANNSIDDKIDKLEDAGLGSVGLTQKLEDARAQIAALEDEIARLKRTEERRSRRLERIRCQKCKLKVDAHHVLQEDDSFLDAERDCSSSDLSISHNRTTDILRQDLQALNEELADLRQKWKEEKKQLVTEKAALQDTANKLNAQVKEEARRLAETERKGEKKRLTVENELENARKTIQELEEDLKSERSRLRSLDTQHARTQRDKDGFLNQLKRTESVPKDMDDVRQQLQRIKQENYELEKELRENATVEQRARLLEKKVAENQRAIESLRQERSSLSADFKDLQRRYTDASERADQLRKEYASSANSHEQRRTELDIRLLEIEDLKRALQKQTKKVQRAEEEKERVVAEKHDVAKTIASLETDLRRVRRDAETFGRDLRALRVEKERAEAKYKDEMVKLERNKKQAQAQLRLLTEELDMQKDEILAAKSHVCAADDRQVSALKLQHNKECKGLLVQIRYLKAKFTREALFRDHLGYQKQYLLEVLSQFERSERKILVSIARIGYPVPLPRPKKLNKFKAAGIIIIFLSRARRASVAWRNHSASKQGVVEALEKMHRRRALAAAS
ncbi:hypothetical protein AN958_12828 [Leucoagaricus sp. SymC.cos]|nr:hypothetical protein AN958_12828 [Leucoagaricus sp. SymC.cos]